MMGRAFNWGLWLAGLMILHILVSCGKRCKDSVTLSYPAELHSFMAPFRPGAWWVYANSAGMRDSVYITAFRETFHILSENDRQCYAQPTREFSLRTTGMDTAGFVHIRYGVMLKGEGAFTLMAANQQFGLQLMGFSYAFDEGYNGVDLVDIVLGSVEFNSVLRADRSSTGSPRPLESILLVQDIGIVAYITSSDTFLLANFHVP